MKAARYLLCVVILLSIGRAHSKAQSLYFPPNFGGNWETTSFTSIGICQSKVDSLYKFLEQRNTKSFIVLKDGKILLEKYFGTYTKDSLWYWASAAKCLVSVLVGEAQYLKWLKLNDPTSKYLGTGWTSCTPTQEAAILIQNQLKMTSGLNDTSAANDCFDPACLKYLTAPDTRWAYHSGPYRLLNKVLENASPTGNTINQITNSLVATKIGMTGAWFNSLYFSKARDMARFGLLILANGKWNNTEVLHDKNYLLAMRLPSQNFNPSYGFLWWLNGKDKYMLPSTQKVFSGSMIPNAPADMISALGANDQKIYIVPSQGVVVVRQGNSAGPGQLALSDFDNILWGKLTNLYCITTGSKDIELAKIQFSILQNNKELLALNPGKKELQLKLYNLLGQSVFSSTIGAGETTIALKGLVAGSYVCTLEDHSQVQHIQKITLTE